MDSQNLGWIKLHRKLLDNPIFKNSALLRLWIYCLLKASYKKKRTMIGFQEVELSPGEFITGRYQLHNALYPLKIRDQSKWPSYRKFHVPSALTLWRWLKILESMQFLNIKSNNRFSVISIINWHTYQGNELENEQQNEHQANIKRTSSEHQVNTNKKVKKVKNDKKKYLITSDLTELLKNLILQNNPKAKITESQLRNWDREIQRMKSIDYRTDEEIEVMIQFSQNDPFWRTNILSMGKLRKQFDQLTLKQQSEKPPPEKPIKLYTPEPSPTKEQIENNQKRVKELIKSL